MKYLAKFKLVGFVVNFQRSVDEDKYATLVDTWLNVHCHWRVLYCLEGKLLQLQGNGLRAYMLLSFKRQNRILLVQTDQPLTVRTERLVVVLDELLCDLIHRHSSVCFKCNAFNNMGKGGERASNRNCSFKNKKANSMLSFPFLPSFVTSNKIQYILYSYKKIHYFLIKNTLYRVVVVVVPFVVGINTLNIIENSIVVSPSSSSSFFLLFFFFFLIIICLLLLPLPLTVH